ncbi:MAG: hypothetical protein AABY22_22735 [Nanoarchaeota archaeon]
MDEETSEEIRIYWNHIRSYKGRESSKKIAIRLFYNILEKYFDKNPIPEELETIKCRVFYRLYSKIEPILVDCKDINEVIKLFNDANFNRIKRTITNKRFRVSLLEMKLKI